MVISKTEKLRINDLTGQIIGAAIEVHKAFGPGLLESVYEDCMAVELKLQQLPFERQKPVALVYKGQKVAADLRIDFLVATLVVVELKSVFMLLPVHEAQLLTYLKLTHSLAGLLINFNVPLLTNGVRRMLNAITSNEPLTKSK